MQMRDKSKATVIASKITTSTVRIKIKSNLKVPTCIFHGHMDIQACRLLQVAMADACFSAAKLGQEPKDEGHRDTDRESPAELGDRGRV